MSFHSHRKLTAWLGLFAIWLSLAMPMVSQAVQRHLNPILSLSVCLADSESNGHAITLHTDPSRYHQITAAACGYCGLLASHPPIPYFATTLAAAGINDALLDATPDHWVIAALRFSPSFARAPPHLFS
jgi:hypothetical protein